MAVPRLAIPALTFRAADGRVDTATTAAYATRAADTWLSTFILSGTTTAGALFSFAQRAAVLDLWLKHTTGDRLPACCWEPADVIEAARRRVRPLVAMRGLATERAALTFLRELPPGAYVYSHPMHTPTALDADLLRRARTCGSLPAGAKISKIPPGALADLHAAAGPDFDLWDGSCRRIAASLDAGASGVVATPLAVVPRPFSEPGAGLQETVDAWQEPLDAVPTESARAAWLLTHALDGAGTCPAERRTCFPVPTGRCWRHFSAASTRGWPASRTGCISAGSGIGSGRCCIGPDSPHACSARTSSRSACARNRNHLPRAARPRAPTNCTPTNCGPGLPVCGRRSTDCGPDGSDFSG